MSATPAPPPPRWARFVSEGLACSCGERHQYPYPMQMLVPAAWPGPNANEPDEALRMEGDFLSWNFCVWDGKYFAIRTRLPIPLKEDKQYALLLSVWCSLARSQFEAYAQALRTHTLQANQPMQARLVNRIAGYPDTFGLMGVAYQQTDGGGGPYALLDQRQADGRNNHPLAIDQRQGVSADRIFEIYSALGHDMRAA